MRLAGVLGVEAHRHMIVVAEVSAPLGLADTYSIDRSVMATERDVQVRGVHRDPRVRVFDHRAFPAEPRESVGLQRATPRGISKITIDAGRSGDRGHVPCGRCGRRIGGYGKHVERWRIRGFPRILRKDTMEMRRRFAFGKDFWMPRAVVTGGAGFLGSHMCRRFVREGYDVLALDNFVTGDPSNVADLVAGGGLELRTLDVSEPWTVEGAVDVVFHMASPASPVDFPTKPVEILMVNSRGTHHALDVALEKGAKFLFASTSEVYGDPLVHPQTEDYWGNVNPIGIRGVYDESKRFGEAITMAYRRFRGVDTKLFRIFNTYGPNMRLDDGRVVPNFIGQALRGEPITVYGTGLQTRSFCYVDDLIEGIVRLSRTDSSVSGPVNIGNPTERTMLEFATEIKRLTGSSSEIVYQPLPTADDPKQRRPDITLARELLGWEPKVELSDGLTRTIAYFKARIGARPRA